MEYANRADIQDFLACHRLALVGVSRNPTDFSRMVWREFTSRGYDMVPVHPEVAEIEGRKAFATIAAIQPAVDGVLLMTPAASAVRVTQECIAAGIRRVWFYRATGQGAASPEAVRACKDAGVTVVPGECPLMFLPNAAWFHRAHGFVKKITGSYPRLG